MHDHGDEDLGAHAEERHEEVRRLIARLRCVMNPTSMRYHGSPVYLVGGALRDPDPRDIDIVVVMPDELFWYAYISPDQHIEWMRESWKYQGNTAHPDRWWKRWARDCTKQASWLTQCVGHIVDFKTQFESEAANYTGERKLVSVPYLR